MMISNEVWMIKIIIGFVFIEVFLLSIGQRTLMDSLSTFETKLNRALEQNALLENELDEKQQVLEKNKILILY
jgi:hypothetical protein